MANATVPAAPPTGVSQRGWYKRNEIAATPWLFLIPGILFFAVYVIFPIFQSVWISFHEWDGLGEMTWVGTANYERLLTDDRKFEVSFWNNVRWLFLYLLAIPAGLFIALFLNQTVRGIRIYKSLFFFPVRAQPGRGRPGVFLVLSAARRAAERGAWAWSAWGR
jgi:multiple sugar transport system permease protein